MNSLVSKRYARALFNLYENARELDSICKDMQMISEIIRTSPEFNQFIDNPTYPSEVRKSALTHLFEKHIQKGTLEFLLLLEEKDRLNILLEICQIFQQLCNGVKNVLQAKIISSAPLEKQQVSDICHHLKLKLRRDVEAQLEVRPGILGGFKVQIGDTVYDFSLRSQLEKFRTSIMQA